MQIFTILQLNDVMSPFFKQFSKLSVTVVLMFNSCGDDFGRGTAVFANGRESDEPSLPPCLSSS